MGSVIKKVRDLKVTDDLHVSYQRGILKRFTKNSYASMREKAKDYDMSRMLIKEYSEKIDESKLISLNK